MHDAKVITALQKKHIAYVSIWQTVNTETKFTGSKPLMTNQHSV